MKNNELKAKKPKVKKQMKALRYRLQELGFVEAALEDLWQLYHQGDPEQKQRAARELALWHANQQSKEGAEQCLALLPSAVSNDPDATFLRRAAVIEAECHHALGNVKQAKEIIEATLRLGATADLYLAAANLEREMQRKLTWVNQALTLTGLTNIVANAGSESLFDRLSCDVAPQEHPHNRPKVTVIMPVYNAQAVIKTALDSVLSQTWSNLEVIVVDDCSTDHTVAIVDGYKKQDDRVQLLKAEVNGGTFIARNLALQVATGEFVTCHDADDWSHPEKIEKQVTHLQQNPHVVANTSQQARATDDLIFYRRSNIGFYIFGNLSSLLFRRREIMEAIGYWDCVRFAGDKEFVQRIREVFGKERVVKLETGCLSFQRQSASSLTGNRAFGFHGFKMGARNEYLESHNHFYSHADSLCYPFPQAKRPFPVPEPMWPIREAKVAGRRHFDMVYAADFRLAHHATLLQEIAAHLQKGLRIGLIQMYRYDVTSTSPVAAQVRNMLDGEQLQMIVYGEKIVCDLLTVTDHAVLMQWQKFVPDVHALVVSVIVGDVSQQNGQTDDILRECKQNLTRYFGSTGNWVFQR